MDKTTDEMIREVYTVLLGVPATGEKGMAKLVYDIEKQLRELNGSVRTNTSWRKALCWIIGLIVAAGAGFFYHILSVT